MKSKKINIILVFVLILVVLGILLISNQYKSFKNSQGNEITQIYDSVAQNMQIEINLSNTTISQKGIDGKTQKLKGKQLIDSNITSQSLIKLEPLLSSRGLFKTDSTSQKDIGSITYESPNVICIATSPYYSTNFSLTTTNLVLKCAYKTKSN